MFVKITLILFVVGLTAAELMDCKPIKIQTENLIIIFNCFLLALSAFIEILSNTLSHFHGLPSAGIKQLVSLFSFINLVFYN